MYVELCIVWGRGLKRNCTRNIVIEKKCTRKLVFFANRNKFIAALKSLFDEIHTVFTAALEICSSHALLTDRASTVASNIRGCQSDTWSAGRERVGEKINKYIYMYIFVESALSCVGKTRPICCVAINRHVLD